MTETLLVDAGFSIGAAQELQTRVARNYFSVDGVVMFDGEYINVPIRVLDANAAGKTYAVILQMNLDGTVYLSNAFNLVVSRDFTGTPEDIVPAKLIEAVGDYTELENGFSTATLPEPTVDVLGTFNFKIFSLNFPKGQFALSWGPKNFKTITFHAMIVMRCFVMLYRPMEHGS